MNYLLFRFIAFLRQKGFLDDSYMVGGAVRDLLFDREVKDIDVAVKGDVRSLTKEFAYAVDASCVTLDEEFSVMRVVKGQQWLDVSRLRCDSIFIDLSERDLTINAMAIPLNSLEDGKRSLIDVYNGVKDLYRGVIRVVSEENLIKDPLRIIRVFRFAATLNFSIDEYTLKAVKALAPLISSVAYERIAEEIMKIMYCPNSSTAVRLMAQFKVLTHIFAISFRESLSEVFVRLEGLINRDIRDYLPDGYMYLKKYLTADYRLTTLKFVSLFDKPNQAINAARQLRLSNREIGIIERLSNQCGTFYELYKNAKSPDSEEMIKFFLASGNEFYGLMLFDIVRIEDRAVFSYADTVIAFYEGEYKRRQALLPLITGKDLIEVFGMSASSEFKKILSSIEFMVLLGKISTREEALHAVSGLINSRDGLS